MRSRFLVLTFTALVALSLVACSSDDSGDDTASDTEADDDATPTTASGPVDQTPPNGANGIKVDDDGDLWVAVLDGNELLRVDRESGEILQRIATPPLAGPDDLVIDADGTIYWTGFTSGEVGAIDPGTGESEELANVGPGANPIALRDDGVLIVGRAVTGSGLYAIDPTGDGVAEPLDDPGNVNSFSIAPDGTLYAPLASTDGGAAVSIDARTGEIIDTIAEIPGIPVALRWHDDQLFVLTLDPAGAVYRVDIEAGTAELFADTGLTTADNLAVDDEGTVYVTGFNQPVIAVFNPDGTPARTLDIGG
jgi:sugar lactone lactonase YvrE